MKSLRTMGVFVAVIWLIIGGSWLYWHEYWQIRERAYLDAAADVKLYQTCFKQIPSFPPHFPPDNYLIAAAHTVNRRDCQMVYNIDSFIYRRTP